MNTFNILLKHSLELVYQETAANYSEEKKKKACRESRAGLSGCLSFFFFFANLLQSKYKVFNWLDVKFEKLQSC